MCIRDSRTVGKATFTDWTRLGAAGWASADLAIDDSGGVEIVGVKDDGRLFTRSWHESGSFGSWTEHGSSNWDPGAKPSIATNGSTIILSAVKDDGRLYTRTSTRFGWGAFLLHGSATWTQADLDLASNGDAWLIGTKNDGRLYVRTQVAGHWLGFDLQGRATWDPTVPPSIAAHSSGAVFIATKADGSLYTRRRSNGNWLGFVLHGRGSWAAAHIDMDSEGTIALAAVKEYGALYTRIFSRGWEPWISQGRPTWSALNAPAITIGSGRPDLLGVKDTGLLYTRRLAD